MQSLRQHIDWIVTGLLLARCAWIFAAPLRSPDLPLRFAQDDFYYYLRPAQNLAWLHRSTFDGSTLTNGYHPLYFLLLVAISVFAKTLTGVFRALWVLDTLSATAIFLLTRKLFAQISSTSLANALAVGVTLLCVPMLCDQMEVTLALPLGFAFLLAGFVPVSQLTPRRAATLGLLGALTFLARLDAAILVLVFVVGVCCIREFRSAVTSRHVAAFAAGCVPLPALYLWINEHYFHTLMPVSGMAKQLRHGWRPSVLLPGSFNGTSEILVNVLIVTAVLAWTLRRALTAREAVFLWTISATPFLFYGLEMLVSDWPIWNWYFYDLRFAAAGAALLIAVLASRDVLRSVPSEVLSFVRGEQFGLGLTALTLGALYLTHFKVDHWMVEVQHAAGVLDGFERTHPGRYAMGDRAGMFAITATSPLLQTEGLVMDRVYLDHIRAQEDLRSVLASYGVNYYVAFVFTAKESTQFSRSCFHAMEPSIAGPDALRMRSDFCEAPVFQFRGADGDYFVYRIQPS